MKKRERKDREKISHRGNNRDLFRKYQLEMDMVHNVQTNYYTNDGELRKMGSKPVKK